MLKIKSIHIQNFKGIEDLEMNFTYQGNDNILDNIVFYGINGVGKSTILEAIYLFLLSNSLYQKEINKNEIYNKTNKRTNNKEKSEVKVQPDLVSNIEKILEGYIFLSEDWIFNKKEQFTIKVNYLFDDKEFSGTLEYIKKNKNHNVKIKLDAININTQDFIYLSSYRLLNPTAIEKAGDWEAIRDLEDESLSYRYRNRFFHMERMNNISSLSLQFDNNYKTTKQYLINLITDKLVGGITKENQDILNKIHEAFKIFFPNKKLLEKLPKQADYYKLAIQNEDKSIVDIDQLSSGEREVIAFFTYLCSKAINSSIIIIDEPELHLHAKWQAIILSSLRQIFPNTQIFMASHSDEIHKRLSKSEIFKLSK
ncbi:MAG: hypothetical protein RLZZ210_729 [Pseudomonadota bacterium]|jgi:predicted ATPase